MMAGCPDIDEVSVVRKDYGQIGIPLHPSNGVVLGLYGLELDSQFPAFVDGNIGVSAGGTEVGAKNRAAMNSSYSKIGETVTVYYSWIRQGSYYLSEDTTPFGGTFEFTLPFEADDPVVCHSSANIRETGLLSYSRYSHLDDEFTVTLTTGALVAVTVSSPFDFQDSDIIYFVLRYRCIENATYLWS